jgi:flagellar basal-body rod modification protein FlgD
MVTATNTNTSLANVSQSTNPSKTETERKKLAQNFDDFLKMLTVQLKNQDPSEPMDTNAFTSQIVQFASVEQQLATNTNLETMIGQNSNSGIQGASRYMGTSVQAKGNAGFLQGGVAPFVYNLPAAAKDVKIAIYDNSGSLVFSGDGAGANGDNLVTWDGKNSITGQKMDDGDYYISVKATGYDGKAIDPKTYTVGHVSAVSTDSNGVVNLTVGSLLVPVSDVVGMRELPSGTSASSS